MPFLGRKASFSGRVRKFGRINTRYRRGVATVCLRNVVLYHSDGGSADIGHVWAPTGAIVAAFNPRIGDWISFNAWVHEYHKAGGFDYGICRLSNLDLMSAGKGPSFADHLSKLSLSTESDMSWLEVSCYA